MVDNLQPRSLSCFRIRKRRHENRMDLRRANSPEPLNMTWAGERSEQPRSFQSPQVFFLLTFPFIERVWLFALDINRANHAFACTVEDGNNDLRPGRAKGREIP